MNTTPTQRDEALGLQQPDESPLSLIKQMIGQGPLTAESVGVVERLVALQERIMERNAEAEFAASFAALQADLSPIQATKMVPDKHGNARYHYVPYEELMKMVQPLARKHGFSISFSTDFREGRVAQTCTLQHIAGHHRDYTSFVRPGSGPYGATETQADGAAMTYAKRYALCNALNIVVEHDTDGVPQDARNEGEPIDAARAQYLREQVAETHSNEAAFLAMAGAKTYEEICNGSYPVLVRALEAKKRR